MEHKPYGPYERFIKRPQDFLCALIATIVLSPVIIAVAILVRVKLGAPVLFSQNRPGKELRSTSLDELPELFNILKGDMAVVGPRPLLTRYLDRYTPHQARRHEVRPGFTGLAQVNGRNAISWEEKFNWDVKYVDHITFLGDWQIVLKTIKTVLKREGISATEEATMEEFMGTEIK